MVRVEYRTGDGLKAEEFSLRGLGRNKDFLGVLHAHEAEAIHSQEATLADIFMEVTGAKLT